MFHVINLARSLDIIGRACGCAYWCVHLDIAYLLLLTLRLASGYSGLAHIALLSKTQAIFAIENWTIATFSLSLATQAIATSMIVLKLWWYSPRQVPAMHRQYVSVMLVIIESGVILTAITAVDLSLFTLHKNAGAMLEPIMSQLSVSNFTYMRGVNLLDNCSRFRHSASYLHL